MIKNKLAEKRRSAGMTQIEAAIKIGVARSTYANWEQGRNNPDKRSMRALDKVFPGWV